MSCLAFPLRSGLRRFRLAATSSLWLSLIGTSVLVRGEGQERGRRGPGADGIRGRVCDEDLVRRREPLAACWTLRFERLSPVRTVKSYQGHKVRDP